MNNVNYSKTNIVTRVLTLVVFTVVAFALVTPTAFAQYYDDSGYHTEDYSGGTTYGGDYYYDDYSYYGDSYDYYSSNSDYDYYSYDTSYDYYTYNDSYDYYAYEDTYDYYTYTDTYDYYVYDNYSYPYYGGSYYNYSNYTYVPYTPSGSWGEGDSYPRSQPAYCLGLYASDENLSDSGNVVLSWNTTGANRVSISGGVGNVSYTGSESVYVNDTTTFVLTAFGAGGNDTCSVTVVVDGNNNNNDDPICDISISDRNIDDGDSVRISWDNTRTDDILLKDNHGDTLIDTEDGDDYDEDSDSIRVRPDEDTTYTLTAYNRYGSDRCRVSVDVNGDNNDVVVISTRAQDPLVAGVSLSNVPYTGFDAGPVLTTIFYTLLVLWGAAVAYFLAVKRTPKAALVHAENSNTTFSVAEAYVPTVETESQHAELEAYAHDARILLSAEAVAYVATKSEIIEEQKAFLDEVTGKARAQFPSEDGWMVLNKARIEALA